MSQGWDVPVWLADAEHRRQVIQSQLSQAEGRLASCEAIRVRIGELDIIITELKYDPRKAERQYGALTIDDRRRGTVNDFACEITEMRESLVRYIDDRDQLLAEIASIENEYLAEVDALYRCEDLIKALSEGQQEDSVAAD